MKKLFIIPALLFCMTGATSNKVRIPTLGEQIINYPINTKVDSINVKAMELNKLIRTK